MEKVLPQEADRASGGFFCKLFVQLPGQRSAAAIEELGAAGIPVTIASRKIEAKEDSCYT